MAVGEPVSVEIHQGPGRYIDDEGFIHCRGRKVFGEGNACKHLSKTRYLFCSFEYILAHAPSFVKTAVVHHHVGYLPCLRTI